MFFFLTYFTLYNRLPLFFFFLLFWVYYIFFSFLEVELFFSGEATWWMLDHFSQTPIIKYGPFSGSQAESVLNLVTQCIFICFCRLLCYLNSNKMDLWNYVYSLYYLQDSQRPPPTLFFFFFWWLSLAVLIRSCPFFFGEHLQLCTPSSVPLSF